MSKTITIEVPEHHLKLAQEFLELFQPSSTPQDTERVVAIKKYLINHYLGALLRVKPKEQTTTTEGEQL